MHAFTPEQSNLLSILVGLADWEEKHLGSFKTAAGRAPYFEMAASLLTPQGQGSAAGLPYQNAPQPSPAMIEALMLHLAQFQALLEDRFVLLEK